MTDWQQPLVVASPGRRRVHRARDRMKPLAFTDALIRMGASIQLHRECLGRCRSFGQRNFTSCDLRSSRTDRNHFTIPDLRGGSPRPGSTGCQGTHAPPVLTSSIVTRNRKPRLGRSKPCTPNSRDLPSVLLWAACRLRNCGIKGPMNIMLMRLAGPRNPPESA